ncbi:MAG: type II toxin-antitoxin system RelE/ParE family toxin [Formivibrio sp.]|nr:type II toxin-antitoxin system RelE/ParE family toxin [Formivibrio sp.]
MPKKIVLTSKAESDLEGIFEHYQSNIGGEKASDLMRKVIEALEMLEMYPSMGRQSQVPDVRELVLTKIPFLAPYRVVQEEIQVLRVIHQRAERTENW